MPPRHGKTETVLAWIAWLLARDPARHIAYVSYAADFASQRCRRARQLAERGGVGLGEKVTESHWETAAGGLVRSTGALGQLTGDGFSAIVYDDPVKNREEAESPTLRRKIYEGFRSDVYTRRDPRGTSTVVVQTRWHPDDLAGQLIRDGWDSIVLPALDDDGTALAEWLWPAEELRRIRDKVGPYTWASLYQGQPRPRGASVFGPAVYTHDDPGYGRIAIGVDLAYSQRTSSDWSVAVVLHERDGVCTVLDVVRVQCKAPDFLLHLRSLASRYPGAPMRWYASGTERGAGDFVSAHVPLTCVPAVGDKFTRAIPAAAAWTAGKIRVSATGAWVGDFIAELTRFTGVGDEHDDQVDALAAAYDALAGANAGTGRVEVIGHRLSAGLPRASIRGMVKQGGW